MSIRTCYKADLLDDTEFIMDASCDLPCPGDRTLFCGGILGSDQKLLHRAIAPNRLLTLYGKVVSSPSDSTSSASATPSTSSLQTTGAQTDITTSGSTSTSPYSQTDSSYPLSSFTIGVLAQRLFRPLTPSSQIPHLRPACQHPSLPQLPYTLLTRL